MAAKSKPRHSEILPASIADDSSCLGDNPEAHTTNKKSIKSRDALLSKTPIPKRFSELITLRDEGIVWFAVPYIDPYRRPSAKEAVEGVENLQDALFLDQDVLQ